MKLIFERKREELPGRPGTVFATNKVVFFKEKKKKIEREIEKKKKSIQINSNK